MSQPTSHAMQQQVERARQEVQALKAVVVSAGQGGDRLQQKVTHAEKMLLKAEHAIKRVKQAGSQGTRPSAAPREGEQARRALAVLRAAPGGGIGVAGDGGSQGASKAPLKADMLSDLYKRASQESKMGIGHVRPDGCGFLCENVFRAYLWFRPVDARDNTENRGIEPEWVGVFGIDETGMGRWSASRHAVFGVLTERANAAARYFWAREKSGADAFVALACWLATHRTMFSDVCDGRRLAFDASRGYFLPACVRSFDGTGGARFTRGSIPLRNPSSSTYPRAAPPAAAPHGPNPQQQQAAHQPPQHAAQQPTHAQNGTSVKMET